MIIYIFVILVVCCCAYFCQQQDKLWLESHCGNEEVKIHHCWQTSYIFTFLTIGIILVAGLRYKVGTDYSAYYRNWDIFASGFLYSLTKLDEPGYRGICYLGMKLGFKDGSFAIFVASAITIGIGYYTIYKNIQNLFIPMILFIAMGCWHASFNAVRQCLAAMIVFYGYPYLKERKLFIYSLCVFGAYLFHKSAIVMIIPFFLLNFKINPRNIAFFVLGAILLLHSYEYVFRFTEEVLGNDIDIENLDEYTFKQVNRLRVLANSAPAFVFLYYIFIKKISFNLFYINIMLLNMMISIITMNSPYLARMGIYIRPFMTIAIAECFERIPKHSRKKIEPLIIFLYLGMFLYEVCVSAHLKNYQWIWNK